MSGKRIEWIDVAKGIAMFLVFFGHVGTYWFPALGTANYVVYLFHMPLFFILSGVFFNPKLDFSILMRRRARQLLIPYYVFSVLMLGKAVGHVLFAGIYKGKGAAPDGSVLDQILAILFNTDNGLWFFWSLFFATLLLWAVAHVCRDDPRLIVFVVLVFLVLDAIIRHYVTVPLPFTMNRLLSSTAYLALGYVCRRMLVELNRRTAALAFAVTVPVFAMLSWLVLSVMPAFGWIAVQSCSIPAAIAGSAMCIVLCRLLPDSKAVKVIGRYSLVFYAFNDIVLKAVKLAAFEVFPHPMLLPRIGQVFLALVIVIVAMVIVYAIIPLVRRRLWWAIGAPRPGAWSSMEAA